MNCVKRIFARNLLAVTIYTSVVHMLAVYLNLTVLDSPLAAQTLFKAGKVITMAGDPLSPGMVLVNEGKIVSVGSALDQGNARLVDLGDAAVLMPGLVNAYSQAGLSGAVRDEVTKEVTATYKVDLGIDWNSQSMKRALTNGITTACLTPGTENVFAGIASTVKTAKSNAAVLQNDGALVANLNTDPTRRNQARQRPDSIYLRIPTNRMGVVWVMRSSFDMAQRNEHDESLAPLRQVIAGERPFFIVSRTFADIETMYTLAEEFGFKSILVGGQESNLVLSKIAELKTDVILTPVPTGVTSGEERTEICLNRAGKLAEHGIRFCLSGDDLLAEARFAYRHGLNSQQALAAVTLAPAQILAIQERVGSIEPGKDADFIVLNGEPLELTSRVMKVIVDGELVFDVDGASR
ncbi:MAG TPA: amidohydrolase family protein [Pirellulaceae bacterium]|nr:amidohydrolase family protein [Pirellulaceae bacterium]HMO92314.1 amidohydrolase family protein [Pirellulaceae bacterium]HMP69238.1 amidohydrolase family protein [Pirellulaceae bacterium]